MNQNNINVFYTGSDVKGLCSNPDLKLTLELIMKIQSEYMFSRTTNVSMVTIPGDVNPAKLNVTVVLDQQIIDFIDDWSNNITYEKMDEITINFLSLNFNDAQQMNALGFTNVKPVFSDYLKYQLHEKRNKPNWYDKLVEGEQFTFGFEGCIHSNSPHYDIILRNFVNVQSPVNPEDMEQIGEGDDDTPISIDNDHVPDKIADETDSEDPSDVESDDGDHI